MKKRILMIGLGLIGGSLALAIKRNPEVTIVGYDIQKEQVNKALSLHVIDVIGHDLLTEAEKADVIIISAPVVQTEEILKQLSRACLKEGVIITDVGSTKKQILDKSKQIKQKNTYFIGGHPMAGSHKSGIEAAKGHLFENAFYILTPFESTPTEKLEELKSVLSGTKANFLQMSAEEHDRIASVISHFPHIIAASLVHNVASYQDSEHDLSRLAAGGFRDITRIASSNPSMWRDILIHNREALLQLFTKWMEEMKKVQGMIDSVNADEIYRYFESAKNYRDGLPVDSKGAIPAFYDLFVDVPDYPGVISEVTGIIATNRISITNIRIIEAREDIYGVLRLSFQTEEDRLRAIVCLQEYKFDTYLSR
ncbi:prephenate dehydrogenase [Bacillus salitolerans]|uniref:Prephenate dehydrogenase n=1 Tax=Bacillus salitolerans TaxID=1437434 RepID=A0ABW4LTV3_9BACI